MSRDLTSVDEDGFYPDEEPCPRCGYPPDHICLPAALGERIGTPLPPVRCDFRRQMRAHPVRWDHTNQSDDSEPEALA